MMRQVIKSETPVGSPIPMMSFGLELDDKERHEQIAKRAYYKAMARGCQPGHEMDDWLEAEAEMLAK